MAEGVERRAPQAAKGDERAKHRLDPPPGRDLSPQAEGAEDGRVQEIAQRHPLGVLGLQGARHVAPEVEPRDLVLILEGHEREEGARHRLAEPGLARSARALGDRHTADELGVLTGVRLVLIGDELGDTDLQHPPELAVRAGGGVDVLPRGGVELARQLHRTDAPRPQPLDPAGIGHRAPARAKGLGVGVDRHAVQRDRRLDGRGAHGNGAGLMRRAQKDQVRHHVIADQGFREPERIEKDVLVLAGDAIDGGDQAPRFGKMQLR